MRGLFCALAACSALAQPIDRRPLDASALPGAWRAVWVEGAAVESGQRQPRLEMVSRGERTFELYVFDGCNGHEGRYATDGMALRFEVTLSTRVFCGGGPRVFMDVVLRVRQHQLDDRSLQLLDENGRLLIRLLRQDP